MQTHQNPSEIVLALDIGGTCIKSALFRDGKIFRRLPPVPSCSEGSRTEIAEALRRAIAGAGGFDHLVAAVPGPFDYEHGIFRMTHKFAAVKDCSFEELSGGIQGTFLHDANAFLAGEATHGAARAFSRCGGITLGTGLGTAFLENGKLKTGNDGSPAPEVKLWNVHFDAGASPRLSGGKRPGNRRSRQSGRFRSPAGLAELQGGSVRTPERLDRSSFAGSDRDRRRHRGRSGPVRSDPRRPAAARVRTRRRSGFVWSI